MKQGSGLAGAVHPVPLILKDLLNFFRWFPVKYIILQFLSYYGFFVLQYLFDMLALPSPILFEHLCAIAGAVPNTVLGRAFVLIWQVFVFFKSISDVRGK
jgi:hypothetical protein